MKITYPNTTENGLGEKIIFHSVQQEPDGCQKTIMPITCIVGRMLGKYKKFEDAPGPVIK